MLRFKGTLAYYQNSRLLDPGVVQELDGKIGPFETTRFYVLRPKRLWRHINTLIPAAFSLRPEFCGNFEKPAGYPRLSRSNSFAVWSRCREAIPKALGRAIIITVLVMPLIVLPLRTRLEPDRQGWLDLGVLLFVCCSLAFLTAAFGDANEPIKHQFLFNLLLDSCLVWSLAAAFSSARSYFVNTPGPGEPATPVTVPKWQVV